MKACRSCPLQALVHVLASNILGAAAQVRRGIDGIINDRRTG